MWLPGTHSTNLKGPVPMGCSTRLSPTDLGTTRWCTKYGRNTVHGSLMYTRTVYVSTASAWVTGPSRSFRGERSEEHTSELQSRENLVCRLLLEKKKETTTNNAQ